MDRSFGLAVWHERSKGRIDWLTCFDGAEQNGSPWMVAIEFIVHTLQ